jgi:hypothetical protein
MADDAFGRIHRQAAIVIKLPICGHPDQWDGNGFYYLPAGLSRVWNLRHRNLLASYFGAFPAFLPDAGGAEINCSDLCS